ncbi:MAG TPA: hypothetical protein VK922_12735 [Gemmatimonadaceae bacterium]|nr:hypothetical protein [Gemmatimonadaceae bacterium]
MRVPSLGVMLLTLCAQGAHAQILDRPGTSEPRAWISGSVGLFDLAAIDDGTSAARWSFSSAAQFRGTLEYSLGRGNALGVSAAYAQVPMRYRPFGGPAEDATGTVSSLAVTFRGGAGIGLHQVFEASIGAVRFSDFSIDDGGGRVGPLEPDYDVTFMIGGGFGYSLNARAQVVLVQEFGLVLHQRSGLPNDANTTVYQRTTRIGLRYGFGNASRG